ncbi:DNRLRE domain-containing protein [Actinosynnema sp. NPDC050801]|uniref:DNRLRE domain-containing protein n=1 Tax=unclassified Actinosynnema TaxID=2637065 RepID=UPI0033F3509E
MIVLVALVFVGLPVGPPYSSGEWPGVGRALAWLDGLFTPSASAEAKASEPPVEAAPPRDPAERVREITELRSETARVFQRVDGQFEAEVSARPEHYRDADGRWQPVDTAVRPDTRDGFRFGNDRNTFRSSFGDKSDKLVRFEHGGKHIALGVDVSQKSLTPRVERNTVVYPDAFEGADLVYQVGDSLKEKIVLHQAPDEAVYRFTLQAGGVTAKAESDGSIGFYPGPDAEGTPLFVMPRPFMHDNRDDGASPYGKAWSDKVTQTVEQQGAKTTITVRADRDWLAAPEREYPVVIDPTITIQPTVTQSQDVMIAQDLPTSNFDGNWRLSTGTTNAATTTAYRSLVRFGLGSVPSGATLSSAQLKMYYDQDFEPYGKSVEIEARRVTAAWNEATATWNSMNAAFAEAATGTQTKPATVSSAWHSFDVRNIVQSWLTSATTNHGFMLKAKTEAPQLGGLRYEAAEYAYNGENANSPKLVLVYGRPSAILDAPTTIHATGAELSWSPYVDPDPANPADDLVEYQVHRTVFQTFTPSPSTLVAPLAPGTTRFADTTAAPTAADSSDPFGAAYYYMIVVKTRDGQLVPSTTELVRLPKAGRIVKLYQNLTTDAHPDTTLSSAQPTANLNNPNGQAWQLVGKESSSFGTTRSVMDFGDLTDIPDTARILDAEVEMWTTTTVGTGAVFDAHPLAKPFVEGQATWQRASTATAWTTPGGDIGPAFDNVPTITNDPKWHIWDATGTVQGWIGNRASNNGVLVKLRNETSTGPTQRAIFLSGEAVEPQLRPKLVVTYTAPTSELTYYTADTPSTRMVPGDEYTFPVTVANTTTTPWRAANQVLSYRWTLPDGTDVTTGGNRLETALPADVVPGASVTVQAKVKTPIQSDSGNKREQYVLHWDLLDRTTGRWLSETGNLPAMPQNVTVEDPTSDQLGLEKFYQYVGTGTGNGSGLKVNPYVGNVVWNHDPFSNPGRGLATFVRMTYNSVDTASTSMGQGWSLAASSIMRLGTPLDLHPKGQDYPTTTTLTDGDGTSHTFELNKNGSTDPARWTYDRPAGVRLFLQRDGAADQSRRWKMTRPDRTEFLFDEDGWLTAIRDKNANELQFTYTERKSNNQPRKFLTYITDPAARRTLTLDYYEKGQAYAYYENGVRKTGTNLTNPKIIDQVETIKDISGRTLALTYSDKGLLEELVDGAGDAKAKTFRFAYDATQGNKNVKLVKVTDPRGNATDLSYYTAPIDPKDKWKVRTITDRGRGVSTFSYIDPDGTAGSTIEATTVDAQNKTTKYTMDGYGRPTKVVNAKDETTELTWDADNNVVAAKAPNGALTTWTYDQKTGVPTSVRDPEANKNNTPAGTLGYQFGLNGYTADLTSKASPEGRRWTFAYDAKGNLASVTDPKGTATATAGDYETTYTYDQHGQLLVATDANGNPTTYSDYDPVGYPRTTKDALNNVTTTVYDVRGNVTSVTDARNKTTTQTYDVFGRPLESRVPKDAATGDFIVTPAPVYDANDNVTTETAPNGAVTTAVYDALDQVTSASMPKDDPTGPARTASFTYDKVGNLLSETSPLGNLTATDPNDHTTRYEHDDIYQVVAAVDALGGRATVTYDNVGNPTTVVDPRKNATADPADFTTKYTYDLNGKVLTETDAAGHVLRNEYDRDGNAVANTDQDGNRVEIRFDERAKPVEIKAPHKLDGTTLISRTTRYEYDEVGNRTREITPRGVETADDPDDFVRQTTYDQLNRVKEEILPYDRDDSRYNTPDKIISSYDAVGNLVETSAPPSGTQTIRNVAKYTHYDNGQIRTSTDAWDITTRYEYDALGGQTKATLSSAGDSVSRTIVNTYFPDGKLRTKSDDGVPVGKHVALVDNSDTANTTTAGTWATTGSGTGYQGYDYRTATAGAGTSAFTWTPVVAANGTYEVSVRYAAGTAANAPYTVHHAGGTTTVTVDQKTRVGEWVSLGSYTFTEGNSHKVVLTNAANGTVVADSVRLVRDNSGDTDTEQKTFAYAYDADGNLTSLTDSGSGARVDTYAMAYDGLARLAKVEEKLAGAVRGTTSFTYDPIGNPLTRSHDRQNATFEYDSRDLVSKVTNTEAGDAPKVTTFGYTKRGEIAKETRGNGNVVDYAYYLDGQIKDQVEKTSAGTLVAEHHLEYSPNGHRTRDAAKRMNADDNSAHLDHVYDFTYDPRDRITKLTRSAAGGGVQETETYVHDANGNVTEETIEDKRTESTYDRNRLVSSSSNGSTSTYNYDPLGRLDTVTSAGKALEKYTYDGFDRVASHRQLKPDNSTETTKYTYDPYDRTTSRTEKAGGSGEETTVFSFLGLSDEVAAEEVNGALKKTYTFGPWNERLGMVKHDGTREYSYYSYNAHTDVEVLTKEDGKARATYGYTAYGKDDTQLYTGVDKPDQANPDKKPYNTYRFNAKRMDAATGDYDMGARDYDPQLNRFLTRDMYNGALADLSLGTDPFTMNRYAFAGGNPISGIEIDGHLFGMSFSDIGHLALDVVGLVPVVGEVADLANAAWYAAEGDYLNAALSAASAIPFAGYAATGAKLAIKGADAVGGAVKASDEVAAATTKTGTDASGAGAKADTGATPSGGTRASDPAPANPRPAPEPAPTKVQPSAKACDIGNSFTPETPVLMGDGSYRAISEIEVGDLVWATDPKTGGSQAKSVSRLIEGEGIKHLVEITVEDGSTIVATNAHPFWVQELRRWVDAEDLHAGNWLRTSAGTYVQVSAVQSRTAHQRVHNLTVDGIHTYYVAAGDVDVLVHNCGSTVPGPNNAMRDPSSGRFVPNPNKPPVSATNSGHGNSLGSNRLTYLYELVDDATGQRLKWGITSEANPLNRYTKKELQGISMVVRKSGTRARMAALERALVQRYPGPRNHESYAGTRRG